MKTSSDIFFESVGSGEPLILISGLNADRLFWSQVVSQFSSRFQVITIDNRGVGKSEVFDPECSTKIMASDVIDVMNVLQIEKANIVGHSLGGCIAQILAIDHSERVKNLVLCSTQAFLTELRKISILNNLKMMKIDLPREIIIKNAMIWLFSNRFLSNVKNQEAFIKTALQRPFEQSLKSYFYQVDALMNHDVSKEINKIKCPALIVHGVEDMTAPVKGAYFMKEQIPNANLILLNDTAHMIPVEDAQVFCDAVEEFLS